VPDDVTVVMATLGRSPFFAEALASALAEDPAEVVVVQDGGKKLDETASSGARLVRIEHAGRSAARNVGVEAAATPFVAFLDDDDLALPGRLTRQRESLLRSPESPLSFGAVRVVDGSRRPLDDWNAVLARRFRALARHPASFADILAARWPIYTSATMVRRDRFLAAGGYDRALDAHEDVDLYLRLSRLGPLAPSEGEPVSEYRLHGSNTPSEHLYQGALAVIAKHLPTSRGLERRLLIEWRIEALWGLGRFAELRREAPRAALADPLLAMRPRFAKRLLGAALPTRLLASRR
jgi:glycosyltransferase involved in cell wall biosynthesis